METSAEKGISLVIFFLVSLLPGMLPILLFSFCHRRMTSPSGHTLIVHLKCFAGGVFFSTCLLNIIVEGSEQYEEFKTLVNFENPYPFFNLGIGLGFFLVAVVERFAVFVSGRRHISERGIKFEDMVIKAVKDSEHGEEMGCELEGGGMKGVDEHGGKVQSSFRSKSSLNVNHRHNSLKCQVSREMDAKNCNKAYSWDIEDKSTHHVFTDCYEMKSTKTRNELHNKNNVHIPRTTETNDVLHSHDAAVTVTTGDVLHTTTEGDLCTKSTEDDKNEHTDLNKSTTITHNSEASIHLDNADDDKHKNPVTVANNTNNENSSTSSIRTIVILLALSFHTLFDGLVVGLQDTHSSIWAMTAAISIHKVIMALSLGLELSLMLPNKPVKSCLLLFLFSIVAPIGVAIGIGVTNGHVNMRAQLLVGSVLQALAAGSMLYVTFFELLRDELGCESSIGKICVTIFGFGAVAIARIWDTE